MRLSSSIDNLSLSREHRSWSAQRLRMSRARLRLHARRLHSLVMRLVGPHGTVFRPCSAPTRMPLQRHCEMDARIAGRVMGEGRQRFAIGLRNIKDIRATKYMDASTVAVFGRIIIGGDVCAATRDRGEDHDPRFSATDPSPEPAPRLIPGHAGRGGALGRDQTLIPEAVRLK